MTFQSISFRSLCFIVIAIIGIGLLHRNAAWEARGGLYIRDGSANIDGYLDSARQMAAGEWKEILSYRPTQLVYPALLSPIFVWKVSERTYIYILHMGLSALFIFLAFLVGRELGGLVYGIITSLFAACFPLFANWFHWAMTEMTYYPLVALFLLIFIKVKRGKLNPVFFLLPSVLMLFTKLDCLPILYLGWSLIIWGRCKKKWNRAAFFVSHLALVSLVISAIALSPGLQRKIKSHFHVAVGLWVSTHTASNANAVEHNKAVLSMNDDPFSSDVHALMVPYNCPTLEFCTRLYMSEQGLKFIRENPLKYIQMTGIRFTALLFPAAYHTAWLPWKRVVQMIGALFVIVGAFLCFFPEDGERRSITRSLVLLGLSSLVVATFYEADVETRFRIPSQIIWGMIAPLGWSKLLQAQLPSKLSTLVAEPA